MSCEGVGGSTLSVMDKGPEVEKQRFVEGVLRAAVGNRAERGKRSKACREPQGSGMPVVSNTAHQAPLGSSAATTEGLGLLMSLGFHTGLIVLLTRIP